MARGTESWKASNHKRPPQNRGKNNKPLPRPDELGEQTISTIPLALQQKCLNIFRDALPARDDDAVLLQEVKGHLYKRDFAAAFGKDEYLKIYASRWSPSRALGYIQILSDVQEKLLHGRQKDGDGEETTLKVVCLGGGAGAEVLALAAWVHETPNLAVQAMMLDIAAWDQTISDLQHAVVNPPVLSKYASAAAKAANVRLLSEDRFQTRFQQVDIIQLDPPGKSQALYGGADLITLMFTLNELYTTSVPQTQKMLAEITASAQPGAHLLVVDSPGSYSTVKINGAEKKYPMVWLLDHTLLGTNQQQVRGEEEQKAKWVKVVGDESRWWRMPEGLEYRVELENMRFQIHLYRRVGEVEGQE